MWSVIPKIKPGNCKLAEVCNVGGACCGYALLQISTDVILFKGKHDQGNNLPNVERNCMESKKNSWNFEREKILRFYFKSHHHHLLASVAICENDKPFFEIINLSSLILCEIASCMGQQNLL